MHLFSPGVLLRYGVFSLCNRVCLFLLVALFLLFVFLLVQRLTVVRVLGGALARGSSYPVEAVAVVLQEGV